MSGLWRGGSGLWRGGGGVVPPVTNFGFLDITGPNGVISGNGLIYTHNATAGPTTGGAQAAAKATGKYYFEAIPTMVNPTAMGTGPGAMAVGFPLQASLGIASPSCGYYSTGAVWANGSTVATLPTYANGDVIGTAYDRTAGSIQYRVNGGDWSASISVGAAVMPGVSLVTPADTITCRFDPASWTQAPPDGSFGPWTLT